MSNYLDLFDKVILDPKVRGSINYAKARAAIEQQTEFNRNEIRTAKQLVIEHLGGKVEHHQDKQPGVDGFGNSIVRKSVHFPDGSKARY